MFSVLGLGFLIGLQHAFEADHLAAVSSIVSSNKKEGSLAGSTKKMMLQGAFWGAGHTVMLFIVAGGFFLLGREINADAEHLLETIVAIMLVGLGAHVLYRIRKEKIHIHVHEHQGGDRHLHAHSHKNSTLDEKPDEDKKQHDKSPHDTGNEHQHFHFSGKNLKSFIIGLIHGTAGSAALLGIVILQMTTPMMGLLYIVVFGAGSILGMMTLSAVIALPLNLSSRYLNFAHQGMQSFIGVMTIFVGFYMFNNLGYFS